MYSSILKINTMASTNILLKLSILILFCTANFFSYLEAFTFVTNTSNSNNVVTCIDREREALIKFKEGVVDPSNFLSSWNIPDCCKWRGVTCNYSTGEVLKLNLSNPNCYEDTCLGGKLTTTTLSELRYLTYLNLSYNSFSGMIPPSLGNLSNLRVLDLYSYYTHLWVSDLNWLSGLSSLEFLDLSYVNLSLATTHWLHAVNMLPSLSELYLPLTELRNIPVSLSHLNLTSLSVLDLSSNYFSTQPPQWLFNISSLTVLNLKSCQLSGQLPKSIGELLKLEILSLTDNKFSGQLPDALGNLKYLEYLDLSYNKLNGSIPKSLGKLENLQTLYLDGNDWEGVLLQDHFQGLSKLKFLYISSTKPSLVLNLSSNWVPPFSLTSLYVTEIKLGPKFPLWLQTQTQIEFLFLQNVSISDKIPNWLWKICGSIMELDLSNNQIRGTIPQRSVVFPSGAGVDLRNNAIEGPLPLWPNVRSLHLSNNSFSGPIPSDIAQIMPELESLSLASNSLNGSIPSSLGKMKNLVLLDMKNNHLSGNIPSSLCSSPTLMYLKLSKNMFSGELPSSLKNCKDLRMLDLGGNRIYGRIPEWIGESLWLLEELSLQGNLFSGRISQKLCHLRELHVLDLGQNNLLGPIPPCLGNLTGMKSTKEANFPKYSIDMELLLKGHESVYGYSILPLVKLIDLSNNILSGYVPEDITNLSGLISLNLSNNHLIGEIPQRIGELHYLETLDLSSNHFSGQIPQSMTSMTFLSNLNLSHNNLSGPIPSSTQFTTFQDKSIYEGNPGLCGAPLSNKCTPNVVKEDGDREHQGQVKKEDNEEKLGLYVSITLGFFVGFWGICGSLVMKKAWRDAYYGFLYKMKDYIIMVVTVKVNQFRRMVETDN